MTLAPAFSSSVRFADCAKAPPPSAMTVGSPSFSASSSFCKASVSIWRKTSSPSSRKMLATVRPQRASTWRSRSTKRHPSLCDSIMPTEVLPAPMKPIRNTARVRFVCRLRLGCVWITVLRGYGSRGTERQTLHLRACLSEIPYCLFLLLLDADCTTVRTELNRGSTRVGGTRKGTSLRNRERHVFLGTEGKIVLHFAG